MGQFAKEVKGAAHIQEHAALFIQQRQIDRAAPAVPGTLGNEASLEQGGLVHLWVKDGLHAGVGHILRPAHEMIHRPLGTVRVVDNQAQSLCPHVPIDQRQGSGGLLRHEDDGLLIPVDALADEIIRRVIPHVQQCVGDYIAHGHEAGGIVLVSHGGLLGMDWIP